MLSESLAQAILANRVTSTEINTYLQTRNGIGAWRVLLKSRSLGLILNNPTALALVLGSGTALEDLLSINGAALAASDSATEAICQSGSALLTIVSNPTLFGLWNDVPANKTRMQSQINAPGSKLGRQIFTSSGTFEIPAGGLLALSRTLVGSGAPGGSVNGLSNYAGSGGGGGATVFEFLPDDLPTDDLAVTIGRHQTTSVGDLSAAVGGYGTAASYGSPAGGGSTVGTITDIDILNAIFQITTGSIRGGSGGYGASGTGNNGGSGGNGIDGTGGGSAGYISGTTGIGGGGGTSIAAGGGGGARYNTGGFGNTAGGTAYGAGGGGAGGVGSSVTGGLGTPGCAVIGFIEGDVT